MVQFQYSTSHPSQNEFDSLPRLPLLLQHEDRTVETNGLVDSGATVSVLPYDIGIQLGAVWSDRQAVIQLSGNLGRQPAIPFFVTAKIANFEPIQLAFAWAKDTDILILGQTNFFLAFNVCFYRSKLLFDIQPIT